MSFDYYASLAGQKTCPNSVGESGLVSGFADECLVWSCSGDKAKNDARHCYIKRVSGLRVLEVLKLPKDLNFEPDFLQLPDSSWFGIKIEFELLSPWYSKDDRPFHVLDNPVRKDKVFGVPFMSAASWKGLLRWACRMQAGLYRHLESHGMKMDGWKDPAWIAHLFGNERAEDKEFSRGALTFYPTWFNKIGFEVINPHNRKTRAGTQPIYYEVVPAGTKGRLRLLYAPLPGKIDNDKVNPVDVIANLIDAITALLETYGISAKRTAGWGAVEVRADNKSNEEKEPITLYAMKESWVTSYLNTNSKEKFAPPEEEFKVLMDEKGQPIKALLDDKERIISKTQFKKLGDKKPDCTNAEFDAFKEWYGKFGKEYTLQLNEADDSKHLPGAVEFPFGSLANLKKGLSDALKGGGR